MLPGYGTLSMAWEVAGSQHARLRRWSREAQRTDGIPRLHAA
jgi:hypothetical protein